MNLTVLRDRYVTDGETKQQAVIPRGSHEVEQISNPFGAEGDWLVLKGTKIGGCVEYWRSLQNAKDPLERVIIAE